MNTKNIKLGPVSIEDISLLKSLNRILHNREYISFEGLIYLVGKNAAYKTMALANMGYLDRDSNGSVCLNGTDAVLWFGKSISCKTTAIRPL